MQKQILSTAHISREMVSVEEVFALNIHISIYNTHKHTQTNHDRIEEEIKINGRKRKF